MASRIAILAAFLVCACPASAQDRPREQAQQALARGEADTAIAILDRALEAAPDDADLLRRLAGAQAAAGDLPLALATIDRALELAPDDNDIRLARARILLWSDRPAEARLQAEAVAAENPDYPELDQVVGSIRSALAQGRRAGFSLSAGLSRIDLESGASSTWKSFGFDAFRQVEASTISASVSHEDRARADTRLTLRLDRRLRDGSAYIAGSVTPSADFREQWSLSAGGAFPLGATTEILLDLRYAQYSATEVGAIRPGLRLSPIEGLTMTAHSIVLVQDGGLKAGASLRANTTGPAESSLFFGAAVYPDTEAGVTRQVRGIFGGITLPVSDAIALRLSGEVERRRDSYTRKGAVLGLSWRFAG